MKNFEDLFVWQKAQELYIKLNSVFKSNKDFFFRDQLLRATLSISNNIAEGFERQSEKEFRYFLFVAKGSCGEVRSMLYLSENLKYITQSQKVEFISNAQEISKMLGGLIKKLKVS